MLSQIAPLTGNYTPPGTNDQKGAARAVDEINAAGGVLGRQLQIMVRDDKTPAGPGRHRVRRPRGAGRGRGDRVAVSNSSLAVIPIAERNQIPYVSTAAADEQVEPVRTTRS